MKKFMILFLVCLVTTTMQAKAEDRLGSEAKPLPALHVEGRYLVDTNGNRVVLHGVMDTPNAWFNGGRWGWSYDEEGLRRCLAYFEKLYTGLEIAHCNIFRLHLDPVWLNDKEFTYPGSVGQSEGTRGEADISHFNPDRLRHYLSTLYIPLLQKALAHGMYVVIRPPGVCPFNLHVGDYYQKYLMEVWDIVSRNDTVQKYFGQVAFELANEPVNLRNSQNEDDAKAMHDYFQPIVDTIRSNGFKGIIWVPGTGFQSNYIGYKQYPIEGQNIGYAVHVYPGWYGCDDRKVDLDGDIEKSKHEFIRQFGRQVPVVENSPIFVSEVDWSPIKEPRVFDKVNEWGDSIYKNLGTWATASTSKWGQCYKAMIDHYGNISMTLTHPHDYLDLDSLVKDPWHPVPAFDGNPEACSGACWQWYTDASTKPNPIVRANFPDFDVIRLRAIDDMLSK